ncbi:hypothetical protein U9M48_019596 [Paspalum notatum var. saurae]|uniref:Reverse transcriptase Ty1/copia-type domain-containing protein n=1 Tax=Paspalum notatum var. saurae TaxID=547442 RepID=A0AAQ3TFZ7_PASNO
MLVVSTNPYMVSSKLLMLGIVVLLLTYRLGFLEAKSDTSLFIYKRDSGTAYLLLYVDDIALYVDDIVLTASSLTLLCQLLTALQASFPMKDLGPLQHFLYTLDLLEHASMTACKPCSTPVDTRAKLSASSDPMADPTLYRSLVGALQYLTFTRLKRILRYLQGTTDLGLFLGCTAPSALTVYTEVDWAASVNQRFLARAPRLNSVQLPMGLLKLVGSIRV